MFLYRFGVTNSVKCRENLRQVGVVPQIFAKSVKMGVL